MLQQLSVIKKLTIMSHITNSPGEAPMVKHWRDPSKQCVNQGVGDQDRVVGEHEEGHQHHGDSDPLEDGRAPPDLDETGPGELAHTHLQIHQGNPQHHHGHHVGDEKVPINSNIFFRARNNFDLTVPSFILRLSATSR